LIQDAGFTFMADVFPEDFWWGVATSAYQIEGSASADGRGRSVWDVFCRTPGRVWGADSGDIACDHYRRLEEDVHLMRDLGVGHYRFSISWPRVMPDGRGTVNERGIDFYDRLTDMLLAHGITPHATLFHWDSPQALEDRYGSWRSREIAHDFARYCSAVARRLGDRISRWMTINEIRCFTHMGYGVNETPPHAPGTVLGSRKELLQTVHHALLAHGLGCQAIRSSSPGRCHIALADNFDAYVPIAETPDHIEAARRAFVGEHYNGSILVPAITGHYGQAALADLGADAPDIQPGDMEIIGQPLDALGFNVYTGHYVRAADNPRGYEVLTMPADYPRMGMPWLHFLPESLYWGARMVRDALDKKDLPIFISENGCSCDDAPTATGEIIDSGRILYTRAYLRSVLRAIDDGLPLIGYFHWSLMDNFEWSYGRSKRFGLVHVDRSTQKRTPKQSFHWYREVIRKNRIV